MANPWKERLYKSSSRPSRAPSFPELLHRGLHASRRNNTEDIVSFQPHGRAFRVHDEARFRSEILPGWFDNLEWEDFLGQLQRYGFRRLENPGPDQGAYYTERFLRGQSSLVQGMREGQGVSHHSGREPDFSKMPIMGFEEITNPFQPFMGVPMAASMNALLPLPAVPPGLLPNQTLTSQSNVGHAGRDRPGDREDDLTPTRPPNDVPPSAPPEEDSEACNEQKDAGDEVGDEELPH